MHLFPCPTRCEGESRFGADIHSSRVPLKIMPVNNNMPKKTGNFKVILDTLTGNKEQILNIKIF